MDSNEDHRLQITEQRIGEAVAKVRHNLFMRLKQKGNGAFVSRHEILGVITDEYSELVLAIQTKKPMPDVEHELIDIAVGCIFAVACIEAEALDW